MFWEWKFRNRGKNKNFINYDRAESTMNPEDPLVLRIEVVEVAPSLVGAVIVNLVVVIKDIGVRSVEGGNSFVLFAVKSDSVELEVEVSDGVVGVVIQVGLLKIKVHIVNVQENLVAEQIEVVVIVVVESEQLSLDAELVVLRYIIDSLTVLHGHKPSNDVVIGTDREVDRGVENWGKVFLGCTIAVS